MRRLGSMWERGQGVRVNAQEAWLYYLRAADDGNVEVLWKVVEFVEKGIAPELMSVEKGALRDRLAQVISSAEGNESALQEEIGYIFYSGEIVEPDLERAVYWFMKAAAGEFAPGMCYLGECYEFGLGVERDEAKAMELYREAAKMLGDERAAYRTARLILNRGPLERRP